MIEGNYKVRVRYADTDKMGVVYHGNFLRYYEIGRVELFRSIGVPYRLIESMGVFMPVRNLKSKFIKTAQYDDLLTIKTILKQIQGSKIFFHYFIYNDDKLINKAEIELIFVDSKTMKPTTAPKKLLKALNL